MPVIALLVSVALAASSLQGAETREIGNDDRAIVHVLNRTGFGPRPGDVEKVRAIGIERYVDQQLHPERIPDAAMPSRLLRLVTIGMRSREIAEKFALPALEAKRERKQNAKEDGAQTPKRNGPEQERASRVMLELSEQKMLRAIYSERQLQEVLTDFWFIDCPLHRDQARAPLRQRRAAAIARRSRGRARPRHQRRSARGDAHDPDVA